MYKGELSRAHELREIMKTLVLFLTARVFIHTSTLSNCIGITMNICIEIVILEL